MLRPPRPNVPLYTVPGATRIPYTLANPGRFEVPSILSGAWQSPEGEAALVFTNVSETSVPFSWQVTAGDVPLNPAKVYNLYVLKNGACVSAQQSVNLPFTLNLTASSTDVIMAAFREPAAATSGPFSGCTAAPPVITSVVNAASFQSQIAPATWVTITGAAFTASTVRLWAGSDFAGSRLPTSLDGVTVKVNGKPAYVEYISPTQINALMPDDTSPGHIVVTVTTATGETHASLVSGNLISPALFTMGTGGKYVAAVHLDGTPVGPPGLFGPAVTTRPAELGEIISIFGTGFGPTVPPTPTSEVVAQAAPLATTPTAHVGNAVAPVLFAGLVSSGLYQFNVQIPSVSATGDMALTLQGSDATSQSGVFVNVGGGR
jgi:uncharacterized protein (TIGR03437 family)